MNMHDSTRWASEVGQLPARHLGKLPVEFLFRLRSSRFSEEIEVHSFELAEPRSASDRPRFDGLEWAALVLGVESERLWPHDFLRMCLDKQRDPSLRVDDLQVLAGAVGDRPSTPWSLTQVLRRLELTLVGVELCPRLSPRPAQPDPERVAA